MRPKLESYPTVTPWPWVRSAKATANVAHCGQQTTAAERMTFLCTALLHFQIHRLSLRLHQGHLLIQIRHRHRRIRHSRRWILAPTTATLVLAVECA